MARATTVRTGGFGIDATELARLSKDLRRTAPDLNRRMRKRLREAGEIVAKEARVISAQDSTKISPTIKVTVAGATVAVTAGGPDLPIAGLLELGNHGGSKSASASSHGTFRHPVFGHPGVWVDQPMHPYLMPAAHAKTTELEVTFVKAIDDTISDLTKRYSLGVL